MPRTVDPLANITLGTQPILIVEVDWAGTPVTYKDKGDQGKILNISGLTSVTKLDSSGSSGSVSVTLDDSDASIKALLNINDIHKRPARILQTFDDDLAGAPFIIFSGVVSSPIVWDEGARTISFEIVNIIEDRQLGFSPEEGEFDFIADSAIGVPWPLAFGDVVRVPAAKITETPRGTSLTRYGQITIPELEQLCALAVSSQQALTAKEIADKFAGFTDENYATVLDNLTGTTIGLNTFLSGQIFDAPSQEVALRQYIDVCMEIERWRVFYDQELAKYQDAERRIGPLESHAGKPAVTGFKFFGAKIDANANTFIGSIPVGFNYGEQEKQGYRVGVSIPSFAVVFREAIPEVVGAVQQAQIALDDFIAQFWVYTTPEQWAQEAVLQDTLATLSAALNSALADSGAALQNTSIANGQIASLNTQKLTLENGLVQILLTEVAVEGGEFFPQGQEIEIIINGMHFKGTMTGRIFTVLQANTPADVGVGITAAQNTNEFLLVDPTIQMKGKYCRIGSGITFVEDQDGARCFINPILYKAAGVIDNGIFSHIIYDPAQLSGTIAETSVFLSKQWLDGARGAGGGLLDAVSGLSQLRQRDYSINIGDDVTLVGGLADIYIANLIESVEIFEVMAFRIVNGVRKLLPVPSRYYVENLAEEIAGQTATTLRFARPMNSLFGENWESDIFVSLRSSEGPNAVDIIEYLALTYTDLAIGTLESAPVEPFPANFAFLDRRGTLAAIEEIAWQSRCIAYTKNGELFVKYIAGDTLGSVATITETEVDRQTLEVTMTETEDLVTEFTAEWDSDYSAEERNKIVLRNNIPKYGLISETFDFYIYNIRDLVYNAMTFWLIRMSNTWKIARFKTPLVTLEVETLDTVLVDLGQEFVATAAALGVVRSAAYNTDSLEIEYEVQMAVRAGELEEYPLFWPADSADPYPTPGDPYAGGAA